MPLFLSRPGFTPLIAFRRLLAALLLAFVVLSGVAVTAGAAQREVGPFDGCYYILTGNTYTGARCPQDDGSDYYYEPGSQGGWSFVMECASFTSYTACLWSGGLYVETYTDGSRYVENAQRTYAIFHPDGTVVEHGHYDFTGQQRFSSHSRVASEAMLNRSLYYAISPGLTVQIVARSNPTIFNALIMPAYGNDYSNCLHLNDSSDDLDNDGRTGFNELAEYCGG